MKSTEYSQKVLDHFRNPRNMGEIENPDGLGKVGNPVCGDLMWIYIKVGKNNEAEEIIDDIKFKTFGCGSAVATSSMITEMAKGKTLDDAYKITRADVAEELEGLPPIKMHCSNLAADALQAAIRNYRGEESEVQVETACKLEPTNIIGLNLFLGKGAYKSVGDLNEFDDERVIIVENGEKSIELALELTKHTGRVVLVTYYKVIPGKTEIQQKLKSSDVKTIFYSSIIEVQGEGEVEKVVIHDFDEENDYELFVDKIIVLDDR